MQIDVTSRKSIYEQVIGMVREMILNGVVKTDDRLPSVRELSKELTVNPNTVQKAYRELERQGYIYTVSGRGCFVASQENTVIDERRKAEVMDILADAVKELNLMKIPLDDIIIKVKEVYH